MANYIIRRYFNIILSLFIFSHAHSEREKNYFQNFCNNKCSIFFAHTYVCKREKEIVALVVYICISHSLSQL